MCLWKLKKSIYNKFLILFFFLIFISKAQGVLKKSIAPDFALLEVRTNKIIRLSKLRGKIVVINFFATWCYPCIKEIPDLIEIYKRSNRANLEFIGILLENKKKYKEINKYLNKLKIPFPVVWGNKETVINYGGVRVIPTTFIINEKGIIVEKIIGRIKKNSFKKILDKYLKISKLKNK